MSGVVDPRGGSVSISITGLPPSLTAVYSPSTQTIHVSGVYDSTPIDATGTEKIPLTFSATTKGGSINTPATLVFHDEI